MFCKRCGTRIEGGQKFCTKCQWSIEQPSQKESTITSSKMKISPHRSGSTLKKPESVTTSFGISPRLVKIMGIVWPIIVSLLFGGLVVYVARGRGVGWVGAIIIAVVATIWASHDA